MTQSMPRNEARGHVPVVRALGTGGRFARGALALLSLLAVVVLCGADAPVSVRPEGMSPTKAVAMALELALLAEEDHLQFPGSLEEARALLGDPDAHPEDIPDLALAAAEAWAGRADLSRRIVNAWPDLQDPLARVALLEDPGPLGGLARMSLLQDFCAALEGSTHLPPAQASNVLARSGGARDPIAALEMAGQALDEVHTFTALGSHRLLDWTKLLAEARVPGPLPRTPLPRADGLPIDQPMAPLLRIGPERMELATRGLVSWREGGLVEDPGPPPDSLDLWSDQAWKRWSAIASRRAELVLAGVIALSPPGEGGEPEREQPLLVAHPDLPLERLVQVLGQLYPHGHSRPCLAVRAAEHEPARRVCVAFQVEAPEGAQIWGLGVGGLHSDSLPDPSAPSWALPQRGARIEDLVLVLEEARHAGRGIGLSATAPGS